MYGHIYTEEERTFFEEYVPGHSYAEIQAAFIEKYGWEITIGQVKSYINNHHLNTGRTGRFVKGQESHNKGVKMSKEVYEKAKHTMFTKGHVPHNHKPVGSERVNVDGYIEVKVEEPRKWRLKHNVVWEQHNGKIPKGSVVIFLDGNKLNVSIENLKLIKRSELLIMNQYNFFQGSAELTETAANVAKLIESERAARKRLKRKEGVI